jgi:hypothetical protein
LFFAVKSLNLNLFSLEYKKNLNSESDLFTANRVKVHHQLKASYFIPKNLNTGIPAGGIMFFKINLKYPKMDSTQMV